MLHRELSIGFIFSVFQSRAHNPMPVGVEVAHENEGCHKP